MQGHGLIKILIEATGLPTQTVERELGHLIEKRGLSAESLSLDDVRELISAYLLDVMVDAKRSLS